MPTGMTGQDFILDEKAREALKAIQAPRQITFLNGRAGSGKSTLIKHWLDTARRDGRRLNVLTVAPTGIAALNVNGVTLHKFMHLKPGDQMDRARENGRRWGREGAASILDALVVDEASMVRADLMDCLDAYLKAARRSDDPFGGLKLVLCGDVAQLPPVVTRQDAPAFHDMWPGPWFFHAHAFDPILKGRATVGFKGVELDANHRQTDPVFLKALDEIRWGRAGETTLGLLARHVSRDWDRDHAMVLAATNRRADDINRMMLDSIHAPAMRFHATSKGEWDKSLRPAPEHLELKEGMRVMLLSNDKEGMWANGSMGTLLGFEDGKPLVLIDPEEEDGVGPVVLVTEHTWEVTRSKVEEQWDEEKEKKVKKLVTTTVGSYTQLPLTPGWAITIHKSQGKTFNRLHLELPDRPLFADGQAYVALSRATSLQGLTLSRPLTRMDVRADPWALGFHQRMQNGFPQPALQESLFD